MNQQLVGVLMLILLFGCVPREEKRTQQNPSNIEKEINQLLHDYYNTMSERDWLMYKEFFSDKATLTTIWQVDSAGSPIIFTNTITEFLAQTENGPDSQPIFEEKLLNAEVSVKHNLAQAWVKYEAKFGTEENLYEWQGYDLFSLIRFEGKWQIVSIVFETIEE